MCLEITLIKLLPHSLRASKLVASRYICPVEQLFVVKQVLFCFVLHICNHLSEKFTLNVLKFLINHKYVFVICTAPPYVKILKSILIENKDVPTVKPLI